MLDCILQSLLLWLYIYAFAFAIVIVCCFKLCLGETVKPASIAGQQQELVSFWAKPYRQKLQALPAPSRFGTMWSAFQTPQGNLADEMEFERHGPLLNIYRPQSAKVWSKDNACSLIPFQLIDALC